MTFTEENKSSSEGERNPEELLDTLIKEAKANILKAVYNSPKGFQYDVVKPPAGISEINESELKLFANDPSSLKEKTKEGKIIGLLSIAGFRPEGFDPVPRTLHYHSLTGGINADISIDGELKISEGDPESVYIIFSYLLSAIKQSFPIVIDTESRYLGKWTTQNWKSSRLHFGSGRSLADFNFDGSPKVHEPEPDPTPEERKANAEKASELLDFLLGKNK